MKHIMLDLETLGNGNNAAIVAIGAVHFNPHGGEIDREKDGAYIVVDPESSVAAGGVMDVSTVLWWMEQSDAARKQTFRKDGCSLEEAICGFDDWLVMVGQDAEGAPDDIAMWGNGATFDNVIIRSAYKSVGRKVPWSFRHDKCYRTVINLLPKDKLPEFVWQGTAHNALDDAITQAVYLQKCYAALGLTQ